MKKIYFLVCMLLLSINASHANTHQNASFKKVQNCDSDYFNGTFCAKKNLTQYKKQLKTQKANFAQKYILLNTGDTDSLELIALDTQTGIAYPLNYQFTGWEDNSGKVLKKPTYSFSLNDSKLCLMGSQYDGDHPGTHETYSNIKNCFMIQYNGRYSSFESTYKDRIQYEYDAKNKIWKPYSN